MLKRILCFLLLIGLVTCQLYAQNNKFPCRQCSNKFNDDVYSATINLQFKQDYYKMVCLNPTKNKLQKILSRDTAYSFTFFNYSGIKTCICRVFNSKNEIIKPEKVEQEGKVVHSVYKIKQTDLYTLEITLPQQTSCTWLVFGFRR